MSLDMSQLVVKDNAPINASYRLSSNEMHLILLAIAMGREQEKGFEPDKMLEIRADTFAQYRGIERHTAYEALKEASKSFFHRYVTWTATNPRTGNEVKLQKHWIDTLAYEDGAGAIHLLFHKDLIPLITRLEKNFTSYDIEQVSKLTSSYALRLYELLMKWKDVGKTEKINLQEFRTMLGIEPNQYTAMCDFKKVVLDIAVSQINEHTDVFVDYEQHKRGRTITGFTFKFRQKKTITQDKQKLIDRDPNTADMFTKYTDAQLGRAVHSKKFMNDYGHLVSPNNSANQSSSAWVDHMVAWLKKDPNNFTKRPIQEYLDDEQAQRF